MFCAPDAGRLKAWLWFRIGDWSDWITCYRQTWRWRGSAHSFREQQRSQNSGNGFIWFTSGSAVQGASSGKALLSSGHTVSLSRFVKVRSRWFIWAWADERFRQQSAKVVRCLVSSRRRVKSRTTQGKQVALSVLFFFSQPFYTGTHLACKAGQGHVVMVRTLTKHDFDKGRGGLRAVLCP